MNTLRWHSTALVLTASLLVTACAPPTFPGPNESPSAAAAVTDTARPAPPGTGGSWMAEVQARIQDASHTFVADGEDFISEVYERGLTARFDADGAQISLGDDVVAVRTVGVGREQAEASFAAPAFGACIEDMQEPSGDCVRRLGYRGAGVTEWWTSREEGFEQGWTVDASPEGDGPLTIEIEVEGSEVTVGDGDLWLQGDAGGLLMVNGLSAWDADGVPLQARFEHTEAGFRVRVEDVGARYPVEVDPVYTTAGWMATGQATGASFGISVAGAGDVNNDGYDDVIVGAAGYSASAGRAYVYTGSASGLSSSAATTLLGEATSDYFGSSVAGAGDVNNDGYDDVIVGAPYYSSLIGRAYLYVGSAGGVSSSAATTLTGEATDDWFGFSVAGAGDVNNDGYEDVIVGAPGYSASAGRAYVYAGSAIGVSATAARTLTGEGMSDDFGYSVAGAGDVNNDGYDDVIVGAFGYSSATGRAYVHTGSASGVSTTAATKLTGEAPSDTFGWSVATAGDVNNDGYDDVLVGAPGYSSSLGRAYVYAGSARGVSATAATTLTGAGTNDEFGYPVAGAGDVDNDGYDDVIVGTDAYSSGTGPAYIYAGSASGVSSSATTTLTGEATYSWFGHSVAGAGDVNGDGYDDVIVGAFGYDMGGAAYTYYGFVDADADGYAASIDCDDSDPSVGPGAARYPDEDGDGYGSSTAATSCTELVGYVETSTDCDDTDAAIHPGATEICDSADTDEDCNNLADDADGSASSATKTTVYADSDGDGYGGTTGTYCDPPAGTLATPTDCDDTDADIHPDAAELKDDGIDQDCDGVDATSGSGEDPRADSASKAPEACGCTSSDAPSGLVLLALGLLTRRRARVE